MPNLNMYRLVVDIGTGQDEHFRAAFMVYATSKPNAKTLFCDERMTVEMATSLEIAQHVRAQLPIIGEPTPPPVTNQTSLEI